MTRLGATKICMMNLPDKLFAGALAIAAAAAPRLRYKFPVRRFLLASSSSSLLGMEGYRPLDRAKFGLRKCLGMILCDCGEISLVSRRKMLENGSPG